MLSEESVIITCVAAKGVIAQEHRAVVRATSKILSPPPVLQSQDELLQKRFPPYLFYPCSQLKSFIAHGRVSGHSFHTGRPDCGWLRRWAGARLPMPTSCSLFVLKQVTESFEVYFLLCKTGITVVPTAQDSEGLKCHDTYKVRSMVLRTK